MAKANARGRSKHAPFVMILNGMIRTPSWKDLTGNAVKLLVHLIMLSKGNNGWGHRNENGQLFLSEQAAGEAIGVALNTASRCFEELIQHGFLRIVAAGHFQLKTPHATSWRLTFQPYPRSHCGPTNEFRDWNPEQKSGAQKLNATGARIGLPGEIKRFTSAKTGPDNSKKCGNAPNPDGAKSALHIDCTMRACSARPAVHSGSSRIGLRGSDRGMAACEYCAKTLTQADRGRLKRFCSKPCRKRAENRRRAQRLRAQREAAS